MEIIYDVLLDTIKLIPVLFIAYLVIELFERKSNSIRMHELLSKYGYLFGSVFAIFPQCGFSVLAATLYIDNKITLGTLISVFIATSDESIPILIANPSLYNSLLYLILLKVLIGIIAGFIVDKIFKSNLDKTSITIRDKEEDSILHEVINRTAKVTIYLLLTNLVISFLITTIGIDNLNNLLLSDSALQVLLASIVGFIPNCAISVLLSELYITSSISFASLLAGLITNAGLGLIILIEYKIDKKDLLKIMSILFICAVLSGLLIQLIF